MVEDLDLSPGIEAERRVYDEACIWDQDITYELQVRAAVQCFHAKAISSPLQLIVDVLIPGHLLQLELTMVLRRLMEHFAAAAFSIRPTRAFDAVRIVVSGCMCAKFAVVSIN